MKRAKIVFWFFIARTCSAVAAKTARWRDAAGMRAMRLVMEAPVQPPPPIDPPAVPGDHGTT